MPNILLFFTDDHGAWATGCYGNSEVATPVLDRLAADGTRFANAFTPTPVCSPARANLLTGRTASQVGIHDWLQEAVLDIGNRDWLSGEKTLFDLLHEAGYYTGLSGKWHLGQSHLTPSGVDYYFGLPRWQGEHNGAYTYVHNGKEVTLNGNKSRFITEQAMAFLEQVPANRDFFLNVGYIATHSPYVRQAHDPELTALYRDASFTDIPPYRPHPWVKNEGGFGPSPDREEIRDAYAGYYAAVTEIDRNIARLLEKLGQLGRLDETLIVYTSDHGCALGHHGFWGKGNSTRPLNMYETSLQVPLIWWGPDIQRGEVIERCVDHYDTFLTLLDRAGVSADPARAYPGTSYMPMLEGKDFAWDDTRFGEYGDLRMVRTPRWKLVVRYPDGPNDLFDLVSDPDETQNLIHEPDKQAIIEELRQRLEAFYTRHENPEKNGLRVKELHRHNANWEAWRDGLREGRGLQAY